MGGRCELVDRDIANLETIRMKYRISSVAPSDGRYGSGGDGQAILFEDRSYGGTRITIRGEVSDLRRAGFSDRASSIRIADGIWEVCDRTDFNGNCEIVDRSITNLARIRLDNRISSIRPYTREYGGGYEPGMGWHGGNEFGQGYEGQRSIFFPTPSVDGSAVADCIRPGYQCGQVAANAFCEAAGLRRAAFFETLRGYRPVWYLGLHRTDSRERRSSQLIDVLCTR
jgi:hypothetical protein